MIGLSFWKGKRVLITGHTGFKGSWLCKILNIAGAELIGYALKPPAAPNLFDISKPDVCSVMGDIRDFDRLLSVFKEYRPEIVIHMAAQPLVLESYKEPGYTFDVNIMGTVNLLECLRLSGTVQSALNVTTDKVYLNREQPRGYREDEQLSGLDPYSNSKSCSEIITYCYKNSFPDKSCASISTARSGNVIGGGDFSLNRLIPDCAAAASKGETIKIRNPLSVRPYQHVLDTLCAYLLIAGRQYENPSLAGAYNIGPREEDCKTSGELADLFCRFWSGASWEPGEAGAFKEANTLRLDCAKIKEALFWEPRLNIEKAVEETVRWYEAYFCGDDQGRVMESQIKEFFCE